MFGTTKAFLDYFGLKKLDDLPPLADLSDWESLRVQLNLPDVENPGETETDVDFAATTQDREVPVLYPEDGEDEDSDGSEDAVAQADDDASLVVAADVDDAAGEDPVEELPVVGELVDAEVPELEPLAEELEELEEPEEELVVKQWPDPVG
jgi:segregation and condensation protein B